MALRLRLPPSTHPAGEPASRGRFGKAMEVTHLKATCFLAHLSMSHPEGQPPPCIGLPKTTWMESHGSGVGSSTRPPQICWLPWCLLACRYIIPSSSHHSLPQCVAIPGLKFPSCKDINTIGPGPTVMMVCHLGHICRDPVSKWGAGFKDPTVSFLRDTVQPRIPACVTLSLLTLRMPTSK